MNHDEYLPLIQAAEYLGVSRPKLKRLIDAGELAYATSPLDARLKLIHRDDLDRLKAALRPAQAVDQQTK